MLTKKEVRAEMRLRADAFREAAREESACDSIWMQVEKMPEFIAAKRILIYMSISGEVQTRGFIARWSGTKQFVLPLVCEAGSNGGGSGPHLELRKYAPEWIVSGYRGIEEPSADAPLVAPADVELALVPGVAFARENSVVWRLGRGGGFYDRLLPQLHCPTIGICYSYRVLDSIPTDPWDSPLTHLITND